jgi:hypothetical protein
MTHRVFRGTRIHLYRGIIALRAAPESAILAVSGEVKQVIYVTGDLHGDIRRFKQKPFHKLRRGDTLIVCGDFGFLWDAGKQEQKLLHWIGRRSYQVLFIEGTHDNLQLLQEYPQTRWSGGLVREISGKLKYLCRGQLFHLEDKRVFVFGGGESADTESRVDGETWWREELPTPEEISTAKALLAQHENTVDYIITHQASRKIGMFLAMESHDTNILETFFDEIREKCRFKRWFFGGYHINKTIPPVEIAVFDAVVPITADKVDG